MESPQIYGAAEECHSSESGWTMYIGSPMEDDQKDNSDLNDYIEDERDFDEENVDANHDDDTSDDSMASDASSGPSHHRERPWANREGGPGIVHSKSSTYEDKVNVNNHCLNYKTKSSTVKNNRFLKVNEEKDEPEVNANGAKFLVHSGKVRKNNRIGKRK